MSFKSPEMDIAQSLDYSYEEQSFLQLSRLKSTLMQQDCGANDTRLNRHRIYRYNYFEDVALNKKCENRRILLHTLNVLGCHLSANMDAMNRERMRTPTPLRELSPSSQNGSDTSNFVSNVIDSSCLPYKLLVVDRRRRDNYDHDRQGVIYLKSKRYIRFIDSHKRQCIMLHVISKVTKLLESGTYMTPRELYYKSQHYCEVKQSKRQPEVQSQAPATQSESQMPKNEGLATQTGASQPPGSQNQVRQATTKFSPCKLDAALHDLCCLVGCSRIHLHILPQSKGLVFGDLRYKLKGGQVINCSDNNSGTLIPSAKCPITMIESESKFVLIVEKDSVFQKLLNQEQSTHFIKNFKAILFTAKGYPDITSRAFLNFLWSKLNIPILALTDADPHGFEIVCSYKFGTYETGYENAHLAIPQIKWLGLLPSDVIKLSLPRSKTLPQTSFDKTKIKSLLSRPYLRDRPLWIEQLRLMQSTDRKAELESLDESCEFLARTYLPNKLRYASWL